MFSNSVTRIFWGVRSRCSRSRRRRVGCELTGLEIRLKVRPDPYLAAVRSLGSHPPAQGEVRSPVLCHLRNALFDLGPATSRDHAGAASPITAQEPIDDLKAKLHQAAVFDGFVYGRRDIPAHMTIAGFVTIEESWRLLVEIRDVARRGSFLCDWEDFVVPDYTSSAKLALVCPSLSASTFGSIPRLLFDLERLYAFTQGSRRSVAPGTFHNHRHWQVTTSSRIGWHTYENTQQVEITQT